MTTELRILTWCDIDARHGEEVPAQYAMIVEVAASAPGARREPARRIDVCGKCMEALSVLLETLEEYGVAPDKQRPTAAAPAVKRGTRAAQGEGTDQLDPGKCLLCESETRRLNQHYQQVHGITAEATATADGFACPTCDKPLESGWHMARHHITEHGVRYTHGVAARMAAER